MTKAGTLRVLSSLLLFVAACVPSMPAPATTQPAAATVITSARYPVTIENCGHTLTFKQAPKRVVTLYPPTTEMMLKLGLQDHLVGIGAIEASAILPDLEAANHRLMVLSPKDGGMSKEILLSAKPDFVFDNQPDYFYDASQGFATREELEANGAQIYSLTAKCGGSVTKAGIEDIYTDLINLGKIFGVADRAQKVIDSMKATVANVQKRTAGKPPMKALIYDSGEGPVNVYGPGTWSYVLELAGGQNVFADLSASYAGVSAEEIATRDIDIFVVPDYGPNYPSAPSAEKRVEFLLKTFPNTSAGKNKRFLILPYQYINPSVENALGVQALAQGFFPETFK